MIRRIFRRIFNPSRPHDTFFSGKLTRVHGSKYTEYSYSSTCFVTQHGFENAQQITQGIIKITATPSPKMTEGDRLVEQAYQRIMFDECHPLHRILQHNSNDLDKTRTFLDRTMPEAFVKLRGLDFNIDEIINIVGVAANIFSRGIGSDLTYIEDAHLFDILDRFFGVGLLENKGLRARSRFDDNSVFDIANRLKQAGLSRDELISFLFMKLHAGWFTDTSPFDSYLFKRLRDKIGINMDLINIAKSLGPIKDLAFLLNEPNLSVEIKNAILPLAKEESEKRWEKYGGKHLSAIRTAAEIVAEKAYWTYKTIRDIQLKRGRPTLTIYNLSTGFVLCAEKFSDQFEKQGMTDEQIEDRIKQFVKAVKRKRREGKTPLEARIEIGEEWLESGQLTRFSVPMFLKHSGDVAPNSSLVKKLEEIAHLANKYNLDVIFIDRCSDGASYTGIALHQLVNIFIDKSGLEHLKISRADTIVHNCEGFYLHRNNNWDTTPIRRSDNPAFIAFNVNTREEYYYDARSFRTDSREGSRYYLPTEDRPELVGCYWSEDGRKEYHDYPILLEDGHSENQVTSSRILFNGYFRTALNRTRTMGIS